MNFHGSPEPTIGVELELQLVDAATLDLVDGIMPLLHLASDDRYVKPEFIQYTVEINSPICRSLQELETQLVDLVRVLRRRCAALGYALCGAGTHPFCTRLAHITPLPRYLAIERNTGYLGHTQITFSVQAHIGMASGEETLRVMQRLRPYMPLLTALSASSPFWWGYDTAFASYRHRILAATRSYGMPPELPDWNSFAALYATAQRAGVYDSVRDMHWLMRPRPDFGTLEIRAMDTQPTLADNLALAALAYLLALHHKTERRLVSLALEPLPDWLEKENLYRASQRGLEAHLVINARGDTLSARSALERLLSALRPLAAQHGAQPHLDRLNDLLQQGAAYERARRISTETGSLQAVVQAAVAALDEELATVPQIQHPSTDPPTR